MAGKKELRVGNTDCSISGIGEIRKSAEDDDGVGLWSTCLDFDIPSPDGPFLTLDGVGQSPSLLQMTEERCREDDYNECLYTLSDMIGEDFLQRPLSELSIVCDASRYIHHLMSLMREGFTALRNQTSLEHDLSDGSDGSDGSSTRSSDSPRHYFQITDNSAFDDSPEVEPPNWMSDVHELLSPSPPMNDMESIKSFLTIPSPNCNTRDELKSCFDEDHPDTSSKPMMFMVESETVSQSMFDAWSTLNLQRKVDTNQSSWTELDLQTRKEHFGKMSSVLNSQDENVAVLESTFGPVNNGIDMNNLVATLDRDGGEFCRKLDENRFDLQVDNRSNNNCSQGLDSCNSMSNQSGLDRRNDNFGQKFDNGGINFVSSTNPEDSDFCPNLDDDDSHFDPRLDNMESTFGSKLGNSEFDENLAFQLTDEVREEEDNTISLMERFSREYPALASVLLEQSKKGLGSHWNEANTEFTAKKRTLEADSSTVGSKPKEGKKISRSAQGHTVKVSKKTYKGPKRPKNGFIRFSVEQRRLMADEHPRLDNREVSRMLGAKWRKMSYEERQPYELEFKKDIEDLRNENPHWRYAPLKRLSHDQIEPMPSRLRPRETLKRKFQPLKRGTGKKRGKRTPNAKVQKLCFPFRLYPFNADAPFCCTTDVKKSPTHNQSSTCATPSLSPITDAHIKIPAVRITEEINTPTQYILYRAPSW